MIFNKEDIVFYIIVIIFVILFVREVVCWYWKINKIVSLLEEDKERQEEISKYLYQIINILEKKEIK